MSARRDQVFIVRLWIEPREIEGAAPVWRGRIEHVSTGEQRYVDSLDEIVEFITAYLVRAGVLHSAPRSLRGRLSHWLKALYNRI